MHPANYVLKPFGLVLGRRKRLPKETKMAFERDLETVRRSAPGWDVIPLPMFEAGEHPASYQDHESAFAATHLRRHEPTNVLDIGSYRLFVLGMLAGYNVTTLDVRARAAVHPNEAIVTGDAKALPLPASSFEAVTTLCALEHFGLGRYGDAFDLEGDLRALSEMKRVLKPGGHLILTTTITRGAPTIAFNAHRIYTREMIAAFAGGLKVEAEAYYSFRLGRGCTYDEVTDRPGELDIYLGCWRKPSHPGRRKT